MPLEVVLPQSGCNCINPLQERPLGQRMEALAVSVCKQMAIGGWIVDAKVVFEQCFQVCDAILVGPEHIFPLHHAFRLWEMKDCHLQVIAIPLNRDIRRFNVSSGIKSGECEYCELPSA